MALKDPIHLVLDPLPQLIGSIEKNRIRVLWLAGVTSVIGVLVLIRLIGN